MRCVWVEENQAPLSRVKMLFTSAKLDHNRVVQIGKENARFKTH